jgi:CO dehydrogenase/acetyl-CoA synthase epsilon subunit
MIDDTKEMKKDVLIIGEQLERDIEHLDSMDPKLDKMNIKAQRNLNKMQRYLEKTSDCKLYIIIAIELFVFIVLMSL